MNIQNVFQQALLAEAAYANFYDKGGNFLTTDVGLKTALQNEGMSASQATTFLTRWIIIDQYTAPSSLFGQTGTGFSATLFLSKDTGQYTFAMRGTELGYPDLFGADFGDLVVDGLPMDQLVEMYNYWQRLTHPGSYPVAKLEVSLAETAALKLLFGPAYTAAVASLQADGAIIDTTPAGTVVRRVVMDNSATLYAGTELAVGLNKLSGTPGNLNVTGHSLGGNLAAAFTRLFPSVNANAITINGAGFPTGNIAGGSGNAAGNIQNLFEKLGGAAGFDSSRIQNIVGDGAKMVSMDSQYGLVQPGKPQLEIFLEEHLGNTAGHSITQMVDSLALYDLFARLDPVLNASAAQANLDKITGILKAASSEANHLADLYATQAHLGKRFTSSRSTACSV